MITIITATVYARDVLTSIFMHFHK